MAEMYKLQNRISAAARTKKKIAELCEDELMDFAKAEQFYGEAYELYVMDGQTSTGTQKINVKRAELMTRDPDSQGVTQEGKFI
jgi:hypothetical protein